MKEGEQLRGDLQQEVMRVLWSRDDATVEEVRDALPEASRGAYTTIQTVLNRLADRGLLERKKVGRALRYAASTSESDYVAGSLRRTLNGASEGARAVALTNLAESLGPGELEALSEVMVEIEARRGRR